MNVELTPEDDLRIQVLLQNDLLAVRIDESFMTLYGLTENGEATIPLSPNTNNDIYLKAVKAKLSEHSLGTTGGYPLYLKRWNRMGNTSSSRLNELLTLGDTEAVMAVANAPGIDLDTAKKTWWCATNTEQQSSIAKFLLERSSVSNTDLAKELVIFLLEFVPFIAEQDILLSTLVVILQSKILTDEQNATLWKRTRNKTIYLVGFLIADPDNLPNHAMSVAKDTNFTGNTQLEAVLAKSLSLSGQNFIHYCIVAFKKIPSEDVIYPLLNCIHLWFEPVQKFRLERNYLDYIDNVEQYLSSPDDEVLKLLEHNKKLEDKIYACYVLSGVCEQIVYSAILHSGAVGSQLRKRIKPISDFVINRLESLLL